MYAFLAMVLLMLLWALRLWYRMHQEETVYAVYKKSDYIFCAAFLLLGILNLYDERRLQYGSILMALGILYGMRRSGISQHNLYWTEEEFLCSRGSSSHRRNKMAVCSCIMSWVFITAH